jgi:competence protein ComEC
VIGGVSLLAGVMLGLAAARLTTVWWLWCTPLACFAVALSPLRRVGAIRCLAWVLMGLWLAQMATRHWWELRLLPPDSDTRVLLEGRIASVPARDGLDVNFDAGMRILEGPGAQDGRLRRVRLVWRDPPVVPRVGERWRLLVRSGLPSDTHNLAGLDVERMGFRDRVHLDARVLPSALNARLADGPPSIDALRARIADRIAERIADPDAAGLIIALAVGLSDGVSTDQWRVFNATGTTHLVAISGLHVTLFAVLATFMARRLWRWLPARRPDREPFALCLGLAAAGFYALLAGVSVPTQRTWLMLAVFVLAKLAARQVSAARTWSLSLVAVLLVDAFAPLSSGFWLSFVAVGVILLIETTTLVPIPRAQRALRLQLSVMLALAPLTFAVFGGVSLAGLLVNLVAIPVISFVLVPLVLLGALTAACWPAADALPFEVAAFLYERLWPAMVWAADFDASLWRFEPAWWWYLMAVPAALLLLRHWPASLRLTAAGMVLPLVWSPSRLPDAGTLRVSVFDAGRGTAVLLATNTHLLLFDTGDSWNTHGTRAARVVIPALNAVTRRRIDLLVLPALNPDRALAAALLANEARVDAIRVGGGWPGTSLPAVRCSDDRFHWDGIEFQTFVAGAHGEFCALRVVAGRHALLLGGDLDAAAERDLLSRLPAGALASDAVLMSRQASALGSSPQWIEAAAAELAIATGGVAASDSRTQAIARWRRAGVRVMDTREMGGIEIGFGTQGVALLATARTARYPFAWRRVE